MRRGRLRAPWGGRWREGFHTNGSHRYATTSSPAAPEGRTRCTPLRRSTPPPLHNTKPPVSQLTPAPAASLDLVKAELSLLDRALSDRHARYERFLFASETCLPVVHPSAAMAALFGDGEGEGGGRSVGDGDQGLAGAAVAEGGEASAAAASPAAAEAEAAESAAVKAARAGGGVGTVEAAGERSWVHARNFPNNGYSKQQQFDTMSIAIPRDCVWKADQWLALTRAHAAAVLTLPMSVGRNSAPSAGLCDLFRRTTASVSSDPPLHRSVNPHSLASTDPHRPPPSPTDHTNPD